MAQYDVYEPGTGEYVVVVQSDWLDVAGAVVVIPLYKAGDLPSLGLVTPKVQIDRQQFLIATHLLLAVPARDLRHPIANLASHRDDILRALDFLFSGF